MYCDCGNHVMYARRVLRQRTVRHRYVGTVVHSTSSTTKGVLLSVHSAYSRSLPTTYVLYRTGSSLDSAVSSVRRVR